MIRYDRIRYERKEEDTCLVDSLGNMIGERCSTLRDGGKDESFKIIYHQEQRGTTPNNNQL